MKSADPGQLGQRLRQARTATGLSVRELARRAGCSASLVSQVERGITTPSAGVVYSLANELGISLDQLFGHGVDEFSDVSARTSNSHPWTPGTAPPGSVDADVTDHRGTIPTPTWGRAKGPEGAGIVQRAAQRNVIELSTGLRWERLTPDQDRRVDFLEVIYEPRGRSSENSQAVRHDGREYLLVLEGEIDAVIGFDKVRLRQGDSLAFHPHTPHQYVNPTDTTARCLSVIVHELAD